MNRFPMKGEDIQKFKNKSVSFLLEKSKKKKDTSDPLQRLTIFWDHSAYINSNKIDKRKVFIKRIAHYQSL